LRMLDQALVDGDLVMLGLGRRREHDRIVEVLVGQLDGRLALLLEPLDRRARAVVLLLAERVEALLEVADLALRLLPVVPELLLELLALRGFGQVVEHPEHLPLHRERGAELVDEELLGRGHVVEHRASLVADVPGRTSSAPASPPPHGKTARKTAVKRVPREPTPADRGGKLLP